MKSAKCSVCVHPMADEINKLLSDGVEYRAIQQKITEKDPTYLVPSIPVFSRHNSNHLEERGKPLPLVWRNGQICFEDGSPLDSVSTMSFLAGIISLASHNATKSPHRVSIRDGLLAADLLLKLHAGVDKLDDFTKAWTDYLTGGKRRTRRRKSVTTVEEITETEEAGTTKYDVIRVEPPNLPAPADEEVEYIDFPEDDDAPDDSV